MVFWAGVSGGVYCFIWWCGWVVWLFAGWNWWMGWVDRSIDTLVFVVPLRLTLGEGLSFVCLVCVF
jgi:hypothetical protein